MHDFLGNKIHLRPYHKFILGDLRNSMQFHVGFLGCITINYYHDHCCYCYYYDYKLFNNYIYIFTHIIHLGVGIFQLAVVTNTGFSGGHVGGRITECPVRWCGIWEPGPAGGFHTWVHNRWMVSRCRKIWKILDCLGGSLHFLENSTCWDLRALSQICRDIGNFFISPDGAIFEWTVDQFLDYPHLSTRRCV